MERIDRILTNLTYKEKQKKLNECEKNRIYCKHGMDHALNVARIMYIKVLEQQLPFEKEHIYAAALLHDLGRADQYVYGTPHHQAGTYLAEKILTECGFSADEIKIITEAIGEHRRNAQQFGSFSTLLYEADKLSRDCYRCEAYDTCNWKEEKKNHTIIY